MMQPTRNFDLSSVANK